MAYKKKTIETVIDGPVLWHDTLNGSHPAFEPVNEPNVQYTVKEAFTANINNKHMEHKKGDIVVLTPTEYTVLKRFV